MALHKSMLEEFGLGTVWVRRGTVPVETSAAVPEQSAVKTDPIDELTALDAALSAAQTGRGNVPQAPSRTPPADLDQSVPSAEPPVFDELPWLDEVPPQAPVAPETIDDTAADIASLDWDTLAARVSVCERCRLCERRTNSVFGVG